MKKNILLVVFLFLSGTSVVPAFSQNFAGILIDYVPAPGQHINIETIGTPQAAQKMVENNSSIISLGSFGGYVVLKFNEACLNHPENPYGIDFTIFGNAFSGSSEPGVVWVMEDKNQNGMPDDTWYEIAGSSHHFSETVRNYEITYFETATRDVLWEDNQGKTGSINANEFNLQEYYPTPEFFPSYPRDSVSFKGTFLKTDFITSASGEITLKTPSFGYADLHSRVPDVDLSLPDNPYTKMVEGAGGDPFDISWAVDSFGNYVDLDSIHFVKVVSASLHVAGWLGEISTDVAWVQAVLPQPQITGNESLLVYRPHPSKVIPGDSLKLEAFYFDKGRVTDEQVFFNTLNGEVATVGTTGVLIAHSAGETQIRYFSNGQEEYSSIKVAVPESINILTDFSGVYPGDTLELVTEVYDNELEKLNLNPDFSSSDPSSGKVITVEGRTFLIALKPGDLTLTASFNRFQPEKTVAVRIYPVQRNLSVLLSIKTADENLLPLQPVEIGLADLNAFVENRQHDYSGLENITLFHALTTSLKKAGVPFKFRDDEAAGNKLYLYMVENDGLFSYGWGGKTNPATNARAWIARVNGTQYVNNFDNIMLSDGDTVVLYHSNDILSEWSFTRLLANKFSVAAGEGLEILLEHTSCTFQDGKIEESGFSPVYNAAVKAGNTWYTNESGMVWFVPEGNFPLVVSSGNDAILITEEIAVSAGFTSCNFSFYPNPVESRLFISGKNSGSYDGGKYRIQLLGSAGTVALEEEVFSLPVHLNLSSLAPGMYQLIIMDGKQLEIHKIIKQ